MKFTASLKSVSVLFFEFIEFFQSFVRIHCLLTKLLTPLTNFICQRSPVKVWTLYHEGLIEKEIQFCYLFEISVVFFWANLSFQNQGAFWILSTIAVETLKKQREVKQANHGFLVVFKFFLFSKFLELLGI